MSLPITVKSAVDKNTYEFLKNRWLLFCQSNYIPLKQGDFIFEKIVAHYQESHRAYHNLNHIYSIFQVLDQYFKLPDPLLEAAIWFHDIIYTIGEPQNERKSAILANNLLKDFFSEEGLNTIKNLIISTEKHIPIIDNDLNKIMLDIDLSILGTDAITYSTYTKAIRSEYKVYPQDLYTIGRREAMSRFLERSSLFYTDTFQACFEAKARENVRLEIFGQD